MEQKNQKGLIKMIILIVVGLVVLKLFFQFDVVDYVSQEEFRSFAGAIWNIVVTIWEFTFDNVVLAWDTGKELVINAINIIKGWIS